LNSLRSRLLAAVVFVCLLTAGAVAVEASGNGPCPGAADCPWNSVSTFPATVDGLRSADDVAVDPSDGDIYVVDSFLNRVVRYVGGDTADPAKREIWGARLGTGPETHFIGEFDAPHGVTVDPDGNVWVAEVNGNRVQKFTEDGDLILVLGGNQGSANGQFIFARDVAVDADGNVYVVETGDIDFPEGGGSPIFHSRVQKFDSDGVFIAKTGDGQFTGGDPTGVAVDGTHVYATDGNRVLRFLASDLSAAPLGDDTPDPDGNGNLSGVDVLGGVVYVTDEWGELHEYEGGAWTTHEVGDNSNPSGIDAATVGGTDYVFVADGLNPHVRRFTTDLAAGHTSLAKPADSQLFRPTGVAVDGGGNVWAVEGDGSNADSNYHRVTKYNPDGTLAGRFGADGGSGSSGGALGEFSFPQDIAAAGDDIYVADSSNHRIQLFDGTDWSEIAPPGAGFLFPSGLALAGGDLYVADGDYYDGRVWKLSGGTWTDLDFPTPDDGYYPLDVAADASGNVYASTSEGEIVKRSAATADWAPIASDLNFARSIDFADGHLFVADTNNDKVVKMTPAGTVAAAWGAGEFPALCPGEINSPEGIAATADGDHVFVANNIGYGISKFSFNGAPNVPACDTDGPSLVLDSPHNGASGVSSTPTFSGGKGDLATDSDTVTVRLYQRAAGSSALRRVGNPLQVTVEGEDWSVDWADAALADGEYWVVASQSDDAGNTRHTNLGSDEWGARRFTVGAATATTPSPTVDAITATKDTTPDLAGTASNQAGDSDVTIKIYSGNSTGGAPIRTMTTPRNGTNWSLANEAWAGAGGALGAGVYTAQASQTNPVATPNEGVSTARTFEVDTTAPVVNLSSPADNSYTKSRQPAITGAAGSKTGLSSDSDLSFQLQKLTSGGYVPVDQGVIDDGFFQVSKPTTSTSFSTQIPVSLADGTYHLRAYQSDASGHNNPQDARSSRLFTIDNQAPALHLSNPVDNSSTTDATPTIDGTAGHAANDGNVRFELNRWTGSQWVSHHNWQISHPASASFSTSVPVSLSPGLYHLRAYQGDSVGNEAAQGPATSRQFTVKAMFNPPKLKISSPGHLSATNSRTPTISGTSDTAGQVRVELHRWTGSQWAFHANYYATVSNGFWSAKVSPGLPDGTYSPVAYQTNLGAQTGNATGGWWDVDTIAPAKPRITSPAHNSKTGTQTPTFSGTADPNAGNKVYLELQGYQNNGQWKVLKLETLNRNGGGWSFKPTDYKLTEGYFAAFAYQYDDAGNVAISDASSFQVDLNAKAPDNPGTNNDTCQKTLDYGPFHVEGTCLQREGLTWVSTAKLSFNGLQLQPEGGNAKVILDPFNLRIAAQGKVKVVLGPKHLCLADPTRIISDTCFRTYTVGPFTLYEGSFDWSWQGKVQLPDKPQFGVPAWGGVQLPQLPGLGGFNLPNLQIPGWGSVALPDFGQLKGPDIGKLSLPSLNAPNITLPEKYFGNFKFDLPKLSIGTSGATNIFGFPIEGRLGLRFADQGVYIDAGLKMPQLLGGTVGDATLFVGTSGNILAKNLHLGVASAPLGPIGFRDISIDFDAATQLWSGRGIIDLPFPPDGLAIGAGAGFKDGQLVNAEAIFEKNIPIATSGLFLYGGSVFFKTVPRRVVGGTIALGLGPAIKGASAVRVDTKIAYTFADPGYQSSFRFDGGIKVVQIPLGSGFVEIFEEGLITFGGEFGKDFGNGFKAKAYVDGWIQGPQKRFNVYGKGEVKLGDWFEFDGEVNVSHIGVGGCAFVNSWGKNIKFGATYKWSGAFNPMWDSCSVGAVKATKATARVAGAKQTVNVPGGEEAYVLGFKGRAGAPDVTLTGPNGEKFSTAGKSGVNGDFLVVHIPEQNLTQVVLHKPAGGSWTVETADGSTPVDQVLAAETMPTPDVDAKVTGKGYERTLEYDASEVQGGQRVTFVESGPKDMEKVIGEVKPGKGKVRFTPIAGPAGKRTIEAVVSEDGVMRFNLDKVATFRASKTPIPAAPRKVVSKRKKGKAADTVRTTWTKVAGAATYRVTVVLNGRRQLYETRRTKLKVPGLFDRSSASISVAGVNALGQVGKAKKAKIKAPKAKHPPKKKGTGKKRRR